ncbi:MAG: hypothetical protein U1F24_11355 [Alphaproteobacteria bacterium]
MAVRSYRDLAALATTAASSRVLNLAMLNEMHAEDAEHRARPLFRNRQLNTAILIKHRLRPNERTPALATRLNATKVVLPFDIRNLKLGGQTFFVGEEAQEDKLRQVAGLSADELRSDLRTLTLIDMLPSLDPFLLREQLRRNGSTAASSYFYISPGDLRRMLGFVTDEIKQLVSLAFGMGGAGESAGRLAEALLSTHLDERLEPLRLTLRLEGDAFREGVFCWKGFLYYKWMRGELMPDVARAMRELDRLRIMGPRDRPSMDYIGSAQVKIRENLNLEMASTKETIDDYDRMFDDLVSRSKANAFRDFLLSAPEKFVRLGERLGNTSHVATFWKFRFPDPQRLACSIEEALDIMQDFEAGLGVN